MAPIIRLKRVEHFLIKGKVEMIACKKETQRGVAVYTYMWLREWKGGTNYVLKSKTFNEAAREVFYTVVYNDYAKLEVIQ